MGPKAFVIYCDGKLTTAGNNPSQIEKYTDSVGNAVFAPEVIGDSPTTVESADNMQMLSSDDSSSSSSSGSKPTGPPSRLYWQGGELCHLFFSNLRQFDICIGSLL